MLNIKDLIGETSQYDKKECLEVKKPKSWLKSVSAFANTLGGWLIWGITDDDCVVGIEDVKHGTEKISELIKDRMDPVPQFDLRIETIDDKNILLLQVFKGKETPYYYVSDGTHIAYLRIGNQSVVADAQDLKRLVLEGFNKTYDTQASQYLFKNHTFIKLKRTYKENTGKVWQDEDYQSFGLVTDNGYLTNAGALLADESPVYCSRVFCTHWYGLDKANGLVDAYDDQELSGSLLALLHDSLDFVQANSKRRWMKLPRYRVNMPDYPERAVQEAITNALIHRDYLVIGSEVHIDIFDDRMEIYSPGGMYGGNRVQDYMTGHRVPSRRRNPVIADLFSRMNLMERRGSGFRKIQDSYHNEVLYRNGVEPQFYSDQFSFFVTLWNLNYGVTTEQIKQLKERLSEGGKRANTFQKPAFDSEKPTFTSQKPAFDSEKPTFTSQKPAFGDLSFAESLLIMNFHKRTQENIRKIHEEYGTEGIFSQSDIMHLLNRRKTAVKDLLGKMREAHLLEVVAGQGKGKYRFVK